MDQLQHNTPNSKRFSVVIRSIDYNAYRAYKLSNDEIKSNKKLNSLQLLRGEHNLMRFPFGLTEQRFRWQTSKNVGEKCELTGTMVKRKSDSMNTSLCGAINIRPKGERASERRSSLTTKASHYKYEENKNSGRTINPHSTVNADGDFGMRPAKNKVDAHQKSTASGSISNLMDKTPEYEPMIKQHAGRVTQGNDIFTPSKPSKIKSKIPVDMDQYKKSNDHAGIKSGQAAEEKSNLSRGLKVENLKSDVFNRTKVEPEVKFSKKVSMNQNAFESSMNMNNNSTAKFSRKGSLAQNAFESSVSFS